MQDALITQPLALTVVLIAMVALSDWAGRIGWLKKLGPAMVVILVGALLANLRIIPSAANGGPVYDPIFAVVVPGSIFLVLLDVHLGALRRAGWPVVSSFLVGALGVMAGVVLAVWLLPMRSALGGLTGPLAGMFTGTYIGGSSNFNAIALAYDVFGSGTEFTAAVVVDNVMTDIWLFLLLATPALLLRLARFKGTKIAAGPAAEAEEAPPEPLPGSFALSVPLALAAIAVLLSDLASAWLAAQGVPLPSILILTTIALIVAQFPQARRLTLAQPIGIWGMLLFLGVVGASADLAALIAARELGLLLFAFVAIVFAVHGGLLMAWGLWQRIDPAVLAIASATNIGGSATAFVIAESEKREDLLLPGILVGSLGNALGTYAGFAVVAMVG